MESGRVVSVFDDLAGQERVVAELRRCRGRRSSGRSTAPARQITAAARRAGTEASDSRAGMTHAWLFTGPPGSGRSVAARAFAAALLCPDLGCGHCASCHQVLAGTHADVLLVRPDGLSYGVRQTRDLVLRAATAPFGGRWRAILFEDADRATEQAANALLKAIEEPSPRTVWLLCAPSPDDLVPTIRSRCRLVTLRTPPASAIAEVLARRDGIEPGLALRAARAAQGHIGRARRLATDPEAARRRAEVLRVPFSVDGLGPAIAAAARLVESADAEAAAVTAELDEPEQAELRRAFGEGSSGKGVAKAVRGGAGALKELSRQAEIARHPAEARLARPRAARPGRLLPRRARRPVRRARWNWRTPTSSRTSGGWPQRRHRNPRCAGCRRSCSAASASRPTRHPLLAAEAMTLALLAG